MGLLHARAAGIGLAGALCFAGCLLDFDGLAPAGTGAESQAGGAGGGAHVGGGGGSPAPECGDNGSCLEAPGAFTGPYRFTSAKGCGEGTLSFRAGIGDADVAFTAAPAECGCACDAPADVGCPSSIQVGLYSDSGCTAGLSGKTLNEGACTDTSGKKGVGVVVSTVTPSGQCTSDGAPSTRDPVEFANERVACEDPIARCEGGELCVPNDAPYCLVGDEPVECPVGFEARYALVRDSPDDLDDTRDCSCGCGQFSGLCDPKVELFSDHGCKKSVGTADAGLCFPDDEVIVFDRARLTMQAVGSCDVDESSSGGVSATARVACCNQPL